MLKTCFIVLTMYNGNTPMGINVNHITEYYNTKEKKFRVVAHKRGTTRVKETVYEITRKIDDRCR